MAQNYYNIFLGDFFSISLLSVLIVWSDQLWLKPINRGFLRLVGAGRNGPITVYFIWAAIIFFRFLNKQLEKERHEVDAQRTFYVPEDPASFPTKAIGEVGHEIYWHCMEYMVDIR